MDVVNVFMYDGLIGIGEVVLMVYWVIKKNKVVFFGGLYL